MRDEEKKIKICYTGGMMPHGDMPGIRPLIVIRKAAESDSLVPRKIIVDILKSSAIITADFTGTLVLHFNQGGMTGSEKVEKGVL